MFFKQSFTAVDPCLKEILFFNVMFSSCFFSMIRMFHFNGDFLVFQNEEHTRDWCDSPGNPCFDCRGITDVTIYEQCADRIMCPTLAEKLIELTFSVKNCFENSESFIATKSAYLAYIHFKINLWKQCTPTCLSLPLPCLLLIFS